MKHLDHAELTLVFYVVAVFGLMTVLAGIADLLEGWHDRRARNHARAIARAKRQEGDGSSDVSSEWSWSEGPQHGS